MIFLAARSPVMPNMVKIAGVSRGVGELIGVVIDAY
jgi:hypothetical protein